MQTLRRVFAAVVAAGAGLALAASAAAAQSRPAGSDTLDLAAAERFVAALESMEPLVAQLDLAEKENPQQALAALAEDETGRAMIAEHGFSSAEWSETAHKVLTGYAALKLEDGGMPDFEEAEATIRNTESLPAERKERLIEALAETEQRLEQFRTRAEPLVPAVRPVEPRLDAVFGEEAAKPPTIEVPDL